MTVTVLSAAKRLASKSGWSLSNLELQKILYLAHMFFMGRTGGEPLVNGHFEAWDYGPVEPSLYHAVKIFGSDPVQNVFHIIPDLEDGPESQLLDEAYGALGSLGPGRLVNATHRPNGAWEKNYIPGMRHCIISNSHILDEYRMLENGGR